MTDLFDAAGFSKEVRRPLADQLRPARLEEVIGQDHLVGEGGSLRRMLASGSLPSIIFWGPTGVGKTTIASLLADATELEFEQLSAVFSGVADLRKVFQRAEERRRMGKGTLLFVDEIHRFNKAQQDGFLPHIESGLVTLVGATTENPSFELNPALLSRAQVMILKRLDDSAIDMLLQRAEALRGRLPLTERARARLIASADGDGRYALNLAETVLSVKASTDLDEEALQSLVSRRLVAHDKSGEGHYNLASALQKSIRGSDVDGALYWTARMLAGGEDPRFIFRRLIVTAAEDIGNADPQALVLAIAARDAYEMLGSPEGDIPLGQLVCYLATAPKSNRSHIAFKQAKAFAAENPSLPPPTHAMNAPTQMMKDAGYGKGYIYDHNAPGGFAGLNYFPDDLPRQTFYEPGDSGSETENSSRLRQWRRTRGEGEG